MSGKEIFDYYQSAALKNGFGSDEFLYGNVLFEALRIEGEEKLFKMLEEARTSGKRIDLDYSDIQKSGSMEPDMVIMV